MSDVLAGGYRAIPASPDARFHVVMHNDFLTPRGRPYKWSDVTATVSRAVNAGADTPTARAHYTWESVAAATGTPQATPEPRPWRFAQGQAFWSYLLNTRVTGAAPDPGPDDQADGARPTRSATPNLLLDIAYPDLPRTPAVDMLLMLSWDVVTMEMLAGHVWSTPAPRTPGRTATLSHISGTWANLQFASAGSSGIFRNSQMTAAWLGVGQRGDRPTSVYRYQCLDCELSVQTGPIEQRGRSSYWGTVEVDLHTGDLVAAEMTEIILATLTGPNSDPVPVQKRRLVQLHVLDDEYNADGQDNADDRDDAAPVVRSMTATVSQPVPRPSGYADHATALVTYLRWQRDFLTSLPASVTPMFDMGFQSVLGVDLPGALGRVRELSVELAEWEGGDATAGERLRKAALGHRQLLEGMLSFSALAVEMAATMEPQHAKGLRALCELSSENHTHVSELLALLGRIAT